MRWSCSRRPLVDSSHGLPHAAVLEAVRKMPRLPVAGPRREPRGSRPAEEENLLVQKTSSTPSARLVRAPSAVPDPDSVYEVAERNERARPIRFRSADRLRALPTLPLPGVRLRLFVVRSCAKIVSWNRWLGKKTLHMQTQAQRFVSTKFVYMDPLAKNSKLGGSGR